MLFRSRGVLLAKALGQFPDIFHEFYRNMVEVGEATGRLDESLSQLAVYLDKQAQLRAKVISAFAYPALLVTVRSEERRVGKECRSRWSPYH